jgi:hypothetical protein
MRRRKVAMKGLLDCRSRGGVGGGIMMMMMVMMTMTTTINVVTITSI